jgi:Domain of unknown function (DUF932)
VMGGHRKYSKMMIRMRHKDYDMRDEAPELVMLDSHDGSSRWKACLGMIKFICMNGMIAGDMVYSKSFTHRAEDLMEQILLELEDIQVHIDRLKLRVDVMKSYQTNVGERILLADTAIKKRFGDERPASFVADMRRNMLHVRRSEDEGNDLYTVMNVIQENILRGGMSYYVNNTVRRVTAINSVDRNVNINQTLWQTAEGLLAA